MTTETKTMQINGHTLYVHEYENFSQYRIGSDNNTAPTVKHFDGHLGGTIYGDKALKIVLKVFPNIEVSPALGADGDSGGITSYDVLQTFS